MKPSLLLNNRAFTIMEVLITLFMFSFGLLGMAKFLQGGDHIHKYSRKILEATLLGQEKISQISLLNYDELAGEAKKLQSSPWHEGQKDGLRWVIFLEEKAPELLEIKVKIESEKLTKSLFFTTYLTKK